MDGKLDDIQKNFKSDFKDLNVDIKKLLEKH